MIERVRAGSILGQGFTRRRLSIVSLLAILGCVALVPALSDAKRLKGTSGDDKLIGTESKDRISGLGGDDRADGRGGNDKLRGGPGGDKLAGGEGADDLGGGAGADKLKAVDGGADKRVQGGGGTDTCIADFVDANAISGCENVQLKGAAGSGGGSGGGGGGGGGGGDGGTENPQLTITTATADCPEQASAPPGSLCQFTVEGTGADGSFGSATVTSGEDTTGGGPVQADDAGNFSGSGPFGCPATEDGGTPDVTLTVEIGEESASTQLPCTPTDGGGEPPPDENGPLTITEPIQPQCDAQGPGALCTFTAMGTGANAQTGSATVTSENDSIGGGAVQGNTETGAFTVSNGTYACEAESSPTLTVMIAGETDTAPVTCG